MSSSTLSLGDIREAALFSMRDIRRISKDWEWKPLEGPDWKILLSTNFVLRGDTPIDTLRTVGVQGETYLGMLKDILGGPSEGVMFSMRIFADPVDFRRFASLAQASNAESYYDPRSAEIVLEVSGVRGPVWLERSTAHEFTHAYMDRVFDVTAPLWFAEGMAEYFSNIEGAYGKIMPGAVNRYALTLLGIERWPLEVFAKLGRSDFYGIDFPKLYAQAWSVVHFLFSRHPDAVQAYLGRKDLDLALFEDEWTAYLAELQASAQEAA